MTATPARAGLDELDALLAAATPGPWATTDERADGGAYIDPPRGVLPALGISAWVGRATTVSDAALIVALRNRAPAMVAAIRAAYALAEEAERKGERPSFRDFSGNSWPVPIAPADLRAALDEALGASGE